MKSGIKRAACMTVAVAALLGASVADAQRGGSGGRSHSAQRASQPRASGKIDNRQVRNRSNSSINGRADINRNTNRNANINVNRNVNVDVDDRYHGGCCHYGWDDDWDDDHPVATALAVTTAVAVTAAAIGSITRTLPPSCANVMVTGIAYYQCGSTWYQPQYAGSTVQYVVVNPPR